MNDDLISRAEAIKAVEKSRQLNYHTDKKAISAHEHEHRHFMRILTALPPAQQQYEPVTAEDFAKTMSENTLYRFMAWHGEALELMERQGFVICKKTM